MTLQPAIVDEEVPKAGTGARVRITSSPRLLLGLVLFLPTLAIVLSVPLLRSSFFRYADRPTEAAERILFETKDRPCDVLLFGDSSAIAGLDSKVIQNATRLRTCNVATTAPALILNGFEPFDRYLARNPRPRVLVIQLGAPELRRMPDPDSFTGELDGIVPMFRYYGFKENVEFIRRRPSSIFTLQSYVYLYSPLDFLKRRILRQGAEMPTDAHVAFPPPPPYKLTHFTLPPIHPDAEWVHFLRNRYSGAADHVLINVAPTSRCNGSYPDWKQQVSGLTDNQLNAYPCDVFVDGLHLDQAGAERLSMETAQQILGVDKAEVAMAHERGPVETH